jgi:hypothetical protein
VGVSAVASATAFDTEMVVLTQQQPVRYTGLPVIAAGGGRAAAIKVGSYPMLDPELYFGNRSERGSRNCCRPVRLSVFNQSTSAYVYGTFILFDIFLDERCLRHNIHGWA